MKLYLTHKLNKQRISKTANGNTIAAYPYDEKARQSASPKVDKPTTTLYNGHGDVVALTDASGNVVATWEYDEWGNITNQTGNIDSPYTYAGQFGYVYDKEVGLYFLKSRYYDAEIGRFTTKDRFKGFENRPASQNQYTYCENNPVNGRFFTRIIFKSIKNKKMLHPYR